MTQQIIFFKTGQLKILKTFSLRHQDNRFALIIEDVKRFYILLTVHLGIIRVNNQPDALFCRFLCVYFTFLHV